MGALREIFVKAVCARGKKTYNRTHRFRAKYHPEELLGCRVTNNSCRAVFDDGKVTVAGRYDLHVWYSYSGMDEGSGGHTQTAVAIQTFDFADTLPVESLTSDLKNVANPECRVATTRVPRAKEAVIDADGVIHVTVEDGYAAEVIGETTLWVPVYAGVSSEHGMGDKDKDDDLWEALAEAGEDVEELSEDDFEDDELHMDLDGDEAQATPSHRSY